MNKLILLILLPVCNFCHAQLPFRAAQDTSWYVALKDSTILYSKKLSVRNSLKDGEYLLLDNNKKIPMSQVIQYKSRTGEYIRQNGPVETYRLEKNGPRLFVYSRSFYYSDSTGSREGHDYFFRKGTMGELQELNYKNLLDAVADNAASVRKLQAGRSTMVVAGCSAAAAFLLTIAGIAMNVAPHARGLPPLMVAGPVIMIGSAIVLFAGANRMDKAISIYNQ